MWSSLQNLLPKVAAKYNFRKTLDAIDVCRQFRGIAGDHLPKESAKNVTPKSYNNHVLTVTVGSSAWAQELHMRGHLIKDALNRKLGKNTVKKIRVLVADGKSVADGDIDGA